MKTMTGSMYEVKIKTAHQTTIKAQLCLFSNIKLRFSYVDVYITQTRLCNIMQYFIIPCSLETIS